MLILRGRVLLLLMRPRLRQRSRDVRRLLFRWRRLRIILLLLLRWRLLRRIKRHGRLNLTCGWWLLRLRRRWRLIRLGRCPSRACLLGANLRGRRSRNSFVQVRHPRDGLFRVEPVYTNRLIQIVSRRSLAARRLIILRKPPAIMSAKLLRVGFVSATTFWAT